MANDLFVYRLACRHASRTKSDQLGGLTQVPDGRPVNSWSQFDDDYHTNRFFKQFIFLTFFCIKIKLSVTFEYTNQIIILFHSLKLIEFNFNNNSTFFIVACNSVSVDI